MISSEYMLNLHKDLMDKREIADSTAGFYVRTLYVLHDKKPFKNLNFLKDTNKIVKHIEADYAPSTQKSIYAVLTSVLSLNKDKPTYKRVYQFYNDKMNTKVEEASKTDSAQKTEKQEENWVKWDEVVKKAEELRKECSEFINGKTITVHQYDALLKYVVLALYTYIAPRRNQDYLDCVVQRVPKTFKLNTLATDTNHLVILAGVPTRFIFNKFKTSKTYGQQTCEIPPPLAEAILWYVKHHPLAKDKKVKSFKFLVGYDGEPLNAGNSITRILNKVFGKAIGSSMLRHIFLSGKYDVKEMEDTATGMGHSVEEQRKYLKRQTPQSCSVEAQQPAHAQPHDHTLPQPSASEAPASPPPPAPKKQSRLRKSDKTAPATE